MRFTKIASLIAWLGLSLGGFKLVISLLIIFFAPDPDAFARRYGSLNLDIPIYVIVVSVGLGVLAEISRNLKLSKPDVLNKSELAAQLSPISGQLEALQSEQKRIQGGQKDISIDQKILRHDVGVLQEKIDQAVHGKTLKGGDVVGNP